MSELTLKYNLLNRAAKEELRQFLDALLKKQEVKQQANTPNADELSPFQKKLLKLGTWSEEELQIFEESRKHFNRKIDLQIN